MTARPQLSRRLAAEAIGTALLLATVVGSGIMGERLAGGNVAVALLANTIATGAGLVAFILAFGPVSGAHFNPAVTVGLFTARRIPSADLVPYIVAQVAGAVAAAAVLYAIASGRTGFDATAGFASNGFGAHSPGGYSLFAALVCEVVMTFFFLLVILGATSAKAPAGFAPIAIGLALTLIHLVSIPVTNTSVNPARSTGVAFFADTAAVSQLWLFWVAPIVGAVLAGFVSRWLQDEAA